MAGIAEREDAFDGQVGQAERRGNVVDAAAFLDQAHEIFPLRHFVGVKSCEVFDHRRLNGIGVIACVEDRAWDRIGVAGFIGNDLGRVESPPSRDDLEGVGAAIGPDDQGL
jgi:hypothetical protein